MKTFFKLPKKAEQRNPIIGVMIGFVVALSIGLCYHEKAADIPVAGWVFNFLNSLEYKTYDLRFRIRGALPEQAISKDIVLLDYDDETEEWAPFPPDRTYYAEIIKALADEDSRTKATFFDIFFFDPFGQQVNEEMAEVFYKKFTELPSQIEKDSEVTGRFKQDMYDVYEILSGDKPGGVSLARKKLQEIIDDKEIKEMISYFNNTAAFFQEQSDMSELAPNRDIVLNDAITKARNVYLAQIVNNAEKTPISVADILFDPLLHKSFSKLIKMQDRTKTENRKEVETNYALRNMTEADFRYLLEESDKPDIDGRKPLPFTDEVKSAIVAEMAKVKKDVDNAMVINDHFAVYITPPDVEDVLQNPVINDLFKKLLMMKDRTKTRRRTEVLVNYALNTFTPADFDKILEKGKVECKALGKQTCENNMRGDCQETVLGECADPTSDECNRMIKEKCDAAVDEECADKTTSEYLDIARQACGVPAENEGVTDGDCGGECYNSCASDCSAVCESKSTEICKDIAENKRKECIETYSQECERPCNRRCKIAFTFDEYNAVQAEKDMLEKEGERKISPELARAIDIGNVMPVPAEKLLDKYRKLINMQSPATFIAKGTAGPGYVKPEFQKYDGTIRTAAPASGFRGKLFLHIDMLLAMRYFGIGPDDLMFYPNKIIMNNCRRPGSDDTFSVTIPLYRRGTVLVNWAGTYYEPNQYDHRSFRKIYENAVKYNIIRKTERGEELTTLEKQRMAGIKKEEIAKIKKEIEFFKGKISMTGLTAVGTHDLNPVPFHPRYPLVGMHANFVNMVITQNFIHTAPFILFIFVIVFLGVFAGYIGGSREQLSGALITGGSSLGFAVISILVFNYANMWMPVVPVFVALIAIYLLVVLYRFMTEGQEAKRMKSMFGTYVNPEVVDVLIENPEMLQLGGKRMDLSCTFIMASGPGLQTEDAEILVDRLNEFFTEMTDAIFEYDGTLDKYEGHIIMAVYGAPVHYDDHPQKICMSCAAMKKKMSALRVKWKEEGKETINITAGVNTGPMIAGNMGSASRFNYTIMGDSVNLSARILGASIQYGIEFMISEYTYERARDAIVGRLVDDIVVVGKEEPVKVYEIIAMAGEELEPGMREFIDAYENGFNLYTERKWDEAVASFEKALEHRDDKPTKMLIERCEKYKEEPPEDGWKGEFVLTSKGL